LAGGSGDSAEGQARLHAAYGTLKRAAEFLSVSLRERAAAGTDDLPHVGGAKVIGNGLRELDRFLCLLLDEAVAMMALPAGFDRSAFVRQTNAANKLSAFCRLAELDAPQADRLRAIGRVRNCLHHCRGIVHDPAIYADLNIAASSSIDSTSAAAPRLSVTFDDLARICRFYIEAGAGLIEVCRVKPCIP
jgi:hypothetical protein